MSADRAPDGPRLAELPPEVRDRLSDEVIDELLAGARTEEEIVGPGRVAGRPHPPAGGAGDGGRADRAPRLRATSGAARRRREHPQRFDAQDASDRARAAGDQSRDRNDSFEPQLVRKGQRRFEGFDEKILALYARGLSTRDIEAHLAATPTPPSRRSSASTSSGASGSP